MEEELRKFRDRLRVIIILYTFCELMEEGAESHYGVFRTEIKIQALNFLLRNPDFLSLELIDLMDNDQSIDRDEIRTTIETIYQNKEPEFRVEEMEKFFYGAYESVDDSIAFLISVGFVQYDSKKNTEGNTYDRKYFITQTCAERIENHLKSIPAVKWYFDRCELIKKYFNQFSGSQLKSRQYRYSEYRDISYKSHIQNINDKVKAAFNERFKRQLV